jgi:uncharacterized membrane protein
MMRGMDTTTRQGVLVSPSLDQRAYRLSSIDLLRGLVIVIMAIDHTRDYFSIAMTIDPMNSANPSVALAFTRWITHFCAPVFVFLAGTSAGLMAARKSAADLRNLLVTRGLWLIFIEIFILSPIITFAPEGIGQFGGRALAFMQVIWAIGASMVLLAFVQYFGRRACLVIGTLIVLGHNLLDGHWPVSQNLFDTRPPLWAALHVSMAKDFGHFHFVFLYPLLPWFGVLLLGFGASVLFEREQAERNRVLLRWGVAITALFIVLRLIDGYGEPNHWQLQGSVAGTVIDFLNTTKYPPSLLFLAMTLGPAAILCACADRMHGALKNILVTYGRVPFTFYIPHFLILHLLAAVLGRMQGFSLDQMRTFPPFFPQGYGISLVAVYGVWLLVVVMLYPLCRWMGQVKSQSRAWYLSYV